MKKIAGVLFIILVLLVVFFGTPFDQVKVPVAQSDGITIQKGQQLPSTFGWKVEYLGLDNQGVPAFRVNNGQETLNRKSHLVPDRVTWDVRVEVKERSLLHVKCSIYIERWSYVQNSDGSLSVKIGTISPPNPSFIDRRCRP